MEEFGDAALVLKWIAWVGSVKSYRIFSKELSDLQFKPPNAIPTSSVHSSCFELLL